MRAGHYNTGRKLVFRSTSRASTTNRWSVSQRILSKDGFSFFSQEGWKILGGVQVICNMPFLMLREGHEMANQSAPGGGAKF